MRAITKVIKHDAGKKEEKRPVRPPQAVTKRAGSPVQFFRETVSELKKVAWPTREQTTNLTTIVVIVSLAVGVFLGMMDWVFTQVVRKLLLGG